MPEKTVNEKQMAAAVEMINESQRPYIYIGGGSLGAEVSDEIMRLAEKIDAPIGCTLMGLSAVATDHPATSAWKACTATTPRAWRRTNAI